MAEKLVTMRKIQRKPGGGFQIVVPKKEVADVLGLKGDERTKIYLDEKNRRWIYELVD